MNDKGLLFFTLSLLCFWLVADDLVGKKRLSNIAGMLTPNIDLGLPELPSKEDVKKAAEEATKETAKKANEVAPDVFFDPHNKEDQKKAKEQAKDKLYNKFVEKYGIGGVH